MGYEYLRNESIIRSKTREFFGDGTVVTVDFASSGYSIE